MDSINNNKYNALVLSGGGVKGFATLGCLQYIIDYKIIDVKNIKLMAGTSIGSYILYFLAIGYNPVEIVVYLVSHNVIESLKVNNFNELLNGIYDYNVIKEHCKNMTLEKINFLPTLKDIYEKFGKELVFTTYNLTEKQIIYISYKNYPDLICLDALRMSSNLPFVFGECIYNEKEYIDGGFVDNFPLKVILDHFNQDQNINSLGIILNNKNKNEDQQDQNNTFNKIFKYIDKFYTLLMLPVNEREKEKQSMAKITSSDIITIEIENVKLYKFSLTNSEKLDLFSLGFNTAKKNFTK
jgi:predicted acylesterase/phospholipase RssA